MSEFLKKSFHVILFAIVVVLLMKAFPGDWKDKKKPHGTEPITLSNGLKVILVPNSAIPVFTSTVVVRTGVINEDEKISGAAHFLEHMLFNGTTRRSQKELYDEVDSLGGYNNAFTRDTFTCFQFLCASTHAAQALDIQSDMLFNSTIPQDKFEKEKGIVREEINKDTSRPSNLAHDAFRSRVFQGLSISRPALGTDESIGGLEREPLLAYYKKFYVPNNAVLLLMGDFDPEKIMEDVKATYGAFSPGIFGPRPKNAITWPDEPVLSTRRLDQAKVTYLDIAMPAPRADSTDCPSFIVLSSMLSSGFRSGLKERLNAIEGIKVTSAAVSYELSPQDLSILRISLELPKDESDPRAVLDKIADLLMETAGGGILEDEVEATRKGIVAEEVYNMEKPHYYSMFKASLIAAAPLSMFSGYEQALRDCTAADVERIASRYLADGIQHMAAVASGPGLDETRDDVLAFTFPARDKQKAGKTGRQISRVLDSGLTMIVSENPQSRVFSVHVLLKNRSFMEPSGKAGIADFVHRMLPKGTTSRDRALLTQELDEIAAHLKVTDMPWIPFDDYYFSPEYSYIRFETLTPYWEKGLRLLSDIVFHPAFDENEVKKVRAEMMVALKRSERSPSGVAKRHLAIQWLGDGPGTKPIRGTAASVGGLSAGDLRAFHGSYFKPSNMIISVVSGVPADQVEQAVTRVFKGKVVEAAQPEAVPVPSVNLPSGKVAKSSELGLPQSYILIGLPLDITRENLAAARVANAVLSSRLAFELREKQGLAYSIGSSIIKVGSGDDRVFLVSAGMGTAKENLEKAEKGILNEIDNLSAALPGDDELEGIKNKIIGRMLMRSLSSEQRAYRLGLSSFRGEPEGHTRRLMNEIRTVTVEDVREIARLLKERQGNYVTTVR
ncbi:M16 family metallopeptidase [Acidobacteriota bacterium]